MPCGCTSGCGCGSVGACAASACIGASMAFATMGAMRTGQYAYWRNRMGGSGEPSPEQQELARQAMMREREEHLEHLRTRLAHLASLAPIPLFRSAARIRREQDSLQARIARLAHELSALEG